MLTNRHGVPLFEGVKRVRACTLLQPRETVTSPRREFSRKSSEYFFYGTEIVGVVTA